MNCKEHKLVFVQRYCENGARRVNRQCLSCGEAEPTAYKVQNFDFNYLPCFNADLKEEYKSAKREKERIEYLLKRHNDRQEWLDKVHNPYLKSNLWAIKRAMIMKRANNICEYCRESKATQVHHRTYDNHGNEPLKDLLAVCNDCHDKIHAERWRYEDLKHTI